MSQLGQWMKSAEKAVAIPTFHAHLSICETTIPVRIIFTKASSGKETTLPSIASLLALETVCKIVIRQIIIACAVLPAPDIHHDYMLSCEHGVNLCCHCYHTRYHIKFTQKKKWTDHLAILRNSHCICRVPRAFSISYPPHGEEKTSACSVLDHNQLFARLFVTR